MSNLTNLRVSSDTAQQAEDLTESLGVGTKSAAIAQSVNLTSALVEMIAEGGKIYVEKDGKQKELVLVPLNARLNKKVG